MTLKTWVKTNFRTIRKTMLASDVARRYLTDMNQPTDPIVVSRTVCELHDLGLLAGPPNHPSTLTRLVARS